MSSVPRNSFLHSSELRGASNYFTKSSRISAMKTTYLAVGILLALAASPARAQTTVDVAKISCRQFISDDIALSKSIAVWLGGYYSGLQHNTVVDLGRMQQNIDKVQDFCRLNMDVTVMDAAKKALGIGK
jgi:acid stress chaperone HdeB